MTGRDQYNAGIRMVRVPRWAGILALLTAASIGIVILVVAASVALIVIPIGIGAALVGKWIYGRKKPPVRRGASDVIEAEYRVLDSGEK